VVNNFKAKEERPNYRTNSGMNMSMVSRQLLSWDVNTAEPDNGYQSN